MAKEEFDFKALQELKIPKYLKEYCKPAIVKKAKAAICFVDLKMNNASKKTSFIVVPFKKMPEAIVLFKRVKAEKLHPLKKVVLVQFDYDGKANEVKVTPKKGGIANELLATRGQVFFETYFQWGFEVVGGLENAADEVATSEDAKEAAQPDGDVQAVVEMIKSLATAVKTDAKQIAANVKNKTVSTEDQTKTDAISEQFEALKGAFEQASEEVKATLQGKYDKILQYAPQVEKIRAAVAKALAQGSSEGEEKASELSKELEALLEKVKKDVQSFDDKFKQVTSSIKESTSTTIQKGADLLQDLF